MARLSVTVAAVCCASLLGISGSFAQDLGGQANRPIESGPIDVAQLTQRADLIVHGVVSSKRTAWIGRVIYTLTMSPCRRPLKGAPRIERRRCGRRWGARECPAERARRPGSADRGTTRRLCHHAPEHHLHARRDVRWHRPRSPGQRRRRPRSRRAENPSRWTPSSKKSARREADDDSPLEETDAAIVRHSPYCRRLVHCHCRRIHVEDARERQPRLRYRRPDLRHRLGFAIVRRNARIPWRDSLVPQPVRDADATSPRHRSKPASRRASTRGKA